MIAAVEGPAVAGGMEPRFGAMFASCQRTLILVSFADVGKFRSWMAVR